MLLKLGDASQISDLLRFLICIASVVVLRKEKKTWLTHNPCPTLKHWPPPPEDLSRWILVHFLSKELHRPRTVVGRFGSHRNVRFPGQHRIAITRHIASGIHKLISSAFDRGFLCRRFPICELLSELIWLSSQVQSLCASCPKTLFPVLAPQDRPQADGDRIRRGRGLKYISFPQYLALYA